MLIVSRRPLQVVERLIVIMVQIRINKDILVAIKNKIVPMALKRIILMVIQIRRLNRMCIK